MNRTVISEKKAQMSTRPMLRYFRNSPNINGIYTVGMPLTHTHTHTHTHTLYRCRQAHCCVVLINTIAELHSTLYRNIFIYVLCYNCQQQQRPACFIHRISHRSTAIAVRGAHSVRIRCETADQCTVDK